MEGGGEILISWVTTKKRKAVKNKRERKEKRVYLWKLLRPIIQSPGHVIKPKKKKERKKEKKGERAL